jgi:hypothetical protein
MEAEMNVNARHKDSVFSFLFSDPDVLRELYSAISGVPLPPDAPVEINTLSDILFMDQINDVSFTVCGRQIVLYEHQSSVNRNMPLRLLLYIARVYEKITDRKKLYRTSLEKIPAPEFIVLYNGLAPQKDHETLRLSDAFMGVADLRAASGPPALELVVQVYNINKGHNAALAEKCGTLGGYSAFVDKVREYGRGMPKEAAMKAAIKHCIDNNILKPFLEKHSSEVFNMLITEWDTEEAKKVWFEEGVEIGIEKGREEGREEGRESVARNALAEGIPIELIKRISGLDEEALKHIQARL